jgi:hypothetical protein
MLETVLWILVSGIPSQDKQIGIVLDPPVREPGKLGSFLTL